MEKRVRKRTLVFVVFMAAFFVLLLFLTYYSKVVYFKKLPRITTVMPERTETYQNGRFLYVVPEQAVLKEPNTGKLFLYTARNYNDILGERCLVTKILIRVEEKLDEGKVLVDGIVREEPIIIEGLEELWDGKAVLLKELD